MILTFLILTLSVFILPEKSIKNDIEFSVDEISYLPKERITLEGEDLEIFTKLVTMLDEVDDVQNVYHNVDM